MKKSFWLKAEQRIQENQKLFQEKDWKRKYSFLFTLLGLEFWKIGIVISCVLALVLFILFRLNIVEVAKAILML